MLTRDWYTRLVSALLFPLLILLIAAPASAQCPVPSGSQTYTIARGDTLYRIATRFGTTAAALQSSNCLTSTKIYAGQILYVPQGNAIPTPLPNNTTVWRTTPATFQPFEHGFMIWLANNSDIWVYSNLNTRNSLSVYSAAEYGALPSNASPAPTGYIQPLFGFGKVWSNLSTHRATLGWATQPESAYTLRFGILNGQMVEFNLPNGTTILRQSDGFWSAPSTSTLSSPGARIDQPAAHQSLITGQGFDVSGQARGLFEASFVLELRAVPSETLLANAIMTYSAADYDVPGTWQTRLTPINYIGAAELRVIYIQPRDGAQVVLTSVPVTFR